MPLGTFQPNTGFLTGTIQANPVDPGLNPNTVIQAGAAWTIQVQWELTGGFTTSLLFGTWKLQAYLERFGPGADLVIPPVDVPFTNGVPTGAGLSYNLSIPALGVPVQPGMYTMAVAMRYVDSANNPTQIAGFVQGPVVEFYP